MAVVAALGALWLAAGGCGGLTAPLSGESAKSPSYERILSSLTRSREVHDGLDPLFFISATQLTQGWVEAFGREYARIYEMDPARRDQQVAEWRAEAEKNDVFFVALFTPDDRANDLDKPDTLWSLRLFRRDGTDAAPAYVRRAKMRPEEIVRFFPYCTTWYRGYLVAFPRGADGGTKSLRLVLTGVQGRATLSWK